MLLFQNDWTTYPNAVIHYETKNQSFLKLASIYHAMGVQNNAFHLALLQPELRDIDPFDENLPIDVKAKVVFECKNNFWYYIREISRIPVPGSLVPTQFVANRGNIALYWFFFNHVMVLIVILRQTGKTTMLMALVTWLLNFGSTNVFINLLTKSEGLKAETLKKVKDLFDELPDYLNFSTKKDIFNSDEVKLNSLNNKFKGNLSSASPKQAEKVGRGFTSPINIIDESAFIENIAIAMGAMLMSGNAARTAAKNNDQPYGTILATTAGNTDDRDGNYIYKIATAATILDEHFFDCLNLDDLIETIYKNSNAGKNEAKRPIVNITLSYRQLGYDDKWLQEKLSENISTPENIKRDIFNQWLSGSNLSPIPKEYIERMRDNVVEIPRSEFYAPYNYLLKWYKPEDEIQYRINTGVSFIVGIDTSDAVGRDDIAFVVRDHTTGEILCTATFNEINLITLADFFVSFLLKYTNSVMIIERRSSAATIIDYIIQKLLQHEVNPFTRLYNTIFQNKEQYEKEFKEIITARYYDDSVFIKYKKHIGFVTSGTGTTSRSELYSTTLMSMLKYTSQSLYDEKLVNQIAALIIKNNRIDHPEGGNDDMVISSLLSHWMITLGKNLSHYGIDTNSILRSNKVYLDEKYSTSNSAYDVEEAERIESEFADLLEQYRQENNPIIQRQLEIKIRKVASEMNIATNVVSVEEMLSNIKRDRRVRLT
jgi:hypothetical protein